MEINHKALSLFDYIGANNQSNNVLEGLAKDFKKDVGAGIDTLDSGLQLGKFEETIALLEKGEIDVDLNIVENYYQFNKQKLDRELAQLAESYDLNADVSVTLQEGDWVVDGDSKNADALQLHLNKDTRLKGLIQQTAKLSQFVEWGQAREQAAIYKTEEMPEEKIVDFLKEARLVISQDNQLILSQKESGFSSRGYTSALIDSIAEKS